MPSAKDILLNLYWDPDRGRIKKELWYELLKDLPHGIDAGGVAVVTFGTPGAEGSNAIDTEVQVTDAGGTAWAEAVILRLTCTSPGTMSLAPAANGSVISGDDTNDMLVETSTTGAFSLEVTDSSGTLVGDIYVMAGATQGSPAVDARTVLTNTFA
jgi:hypothetical protein